MIELHGDILNEIFDYFDTNHSMYRIRAVSRRWREICHEYGYIREVTLGCRGMSSAWMIDIPSVRRITCEGLPMPHEWIFRPWVRYMHFNWCLFGTSYIDPLVSPDTREICVDGVLSQRLIVIFKINWRKFPNLGKLNIKIPDMDLEGIGICSNLTCLNVETTKTRNKKLPAEIAALPKLEYLISNYQIRDKLHFVSPNLRVLLVGKLYACTAASNLVPNRHLNDVNFI